MWYVFVVLLAFIYLVTLVRFSRWLAFAQQKEYRFDRLWLFLTTTEGMQELLRLTTIQDWSRTGFKRPRITMRLFLTALTSAFLLISFSIFLIQLTILEKNFESQIFLAGLTSLFSLPFIVMFCAVLPTFLLELYTRYLLTLAAEKLAVHKPYIIGITGSYGKTATKLLLAHVLSQKWSVFLPPRSYNTIYSISKSILHSYTNQKYAIIEYAAYRMGEIATLAQKLKPHDAIITGLIGQHLGLFGSLENIIVAKSELIAAVPAGGKIYYANLAAEKIVLPGILDSKTVARIKDFEMRAKLDDWGKLQIFYKNSFVPTKLVGWQYLDTVKTVWRVAQDLGMTEAECMRGLESFSPTSGFTQSYELSSKVLVIDDGGTSNAAGFMATLALAEKLKGKQKILVTSGIVDLGRESTYIHDELATHAREVCEEVWHVGTAGLSSFTHHFGKNLYTHQAIISERFNKLEGGAMVVIEGRMPSWFMELLEAKRK